MSLFEIPTGVPAGPPAPAKQVRRKAPKANDKKSMPDWLVAKLEDDGVLDTSKSGPSATRRTRMIFCPGCHHHVMRGLLSMPTPWAVDADPSALSAQGEVLALLDGRVTYDLFWRWDHYEIERRGSWQWNHRAGDDASDRDIVAEHRCAEPAHWPTVPSRLPLPRRSVMDVELPDEPPF